MAKITVSNLGTAESLFSDLTATELEATNGGLADNLLYGGLLNGNTITTGDVLSGNTVPVTTVVSAANNLLGGLGLGI